MEMIEEARKGDYIHNLTRRSSVLGRMLDMTDQKRKEEFWNLREEEKELRQTIVCYRSKADRYFQKLGYILDCFQYLSENRSSDNTPDFKGYPSREELKAVFSGLYEAENRLNVVQHRLAQFD